MEDSGVYVLPPHRVVSVPSGFDEASFLKSMERYFTLEQYSITDDNLDELIASLERAGKGHFGYFAGGGTAYLLSVRDRSSLMKLLPDEMNEVVKSLDVSILHKAIIEKIMALSGAEISFTRDPDEAVEMLRSKNRVIFFINATTVDEVKDVSRVGQLMPQKSTFFYPKVCSGLVFHLLRE
jgi:uncharacterized protein (DUF1015 family)